MCDSMWSVFCDREAKSEGGVKLDGACAPATQHRDVKVHGGSRISATRGVKLIY